MYKRAFIVFVLLGLLLASPLPVGAQNNPAVAEPSAPRPLQIEGNHAIVTFADLGYGDSDLVSPYDSTRVLFSIPPNWKLTTGSSVELTYDITLSGADVAKLPAGQNPYGGVITLSFNNQIIGSIPMGELGTHTVRFDIPAQAFAATRLDGRHQLLISLNAQFTCVYDIHAIVSIKNTSLFDLRFETSAPELNLTKLPAPFFLRNSLVPDSTLLVMPENPSELELQSAMNVMAGFGAMIDTDYNVQAVSVGQLVEADLQQNHLIFVGKPADLGPLSSVKFPVPVANGAFSGLPAESAKDGVLEMAASPWNANKVVLLVSGADDAAVAKAAQAVSTGKIVSYVNPSLAYVSDVQPQVQIAGVLTDFTLEDLGYANETLSGIGNNSVQYRFYVSQEQVSSTEASIALLYYHSSLLDYGVSSMTVTLNDQIVGSAVFNKDSEQLTTLDIKIPGDILRFGENRLDVTGRMEAQTSCDTSGFSDPWLVISNQSSLHLPTAQSALGTQKLADLKFYPRLFVTHGDLGDVAFVLPKANAASWKTAGQIAYDLGRTAIPLISDLRVAYADNVPSDVREGYSMILVGKASDLGILSELNDSLPAPFDLAANTASERDMQVVYRIPPGVSVGYLELLHSPFNPEKMILIASGNDDTGLGMASAALTLAPLKNQLAGQFAVTNGLQLATSSLASQFSIVGTVVPGSEQVITTPVAPVAGPGFTRPAWLTLLPIVSGVLALLIILYVIILTAVRRRNALPAEPITTPRPGEGDTGEKKK